MQTVVYNSPLYYLVLLSVVYSMYIIIKLVSYYYYFIIIFFPHERRSLHDPILVLMNLISSLSYRLPVYNSINITFFQFTLSQIIHIKISLLYIYFNILYS